MAAVLIKSRRCCGSRSEIVWVDGFKFGSTVGCAFFQSKYPVESFFSQNARSAASLANLGVVLSRFLINPAFLPMHVSSRNHPNELVGISQGKGDVQSPSLNGLAESMKAR